MSIATGAQRKIRGMGLPRLTDRGVQSTGRYGDRPRLNMSRCVEKRFDDVVSDGLAVEKELGYLKDHGPP